MHKLLLILFLAGTASAFGQLLMPIQYDTNLIDHEIIFSGDSEYHSTSLRKGFANRLVYGGAISNEVKDKTFKSHGDNSKINKFGKDIQGEIEYRNYKANMFGKTNWGFLVKGGYYFIGSGAYATDMFGLAFYGNEQYLGKTAEFNGAFGNFCAFQKLGFGIIGKKTKSSVTLNLVNVSNLYSTRVEKAELTQNEDGSDITLEADGFFAYTDKASFNNGTGLALDFDFKIPVRWLKDQQAYIQVQARNLGFAYMHQGLKTYSADSTYHYSGFDFDQLFGNQSLFSGDFSILDTLSVGDERKKSVVTLPAMLQIGKIIDENHSGKWQSFFGIRIYPTLPSSPLLFAGGNWRAQPWLDLGLSASYGGFGRFRGGFYASLKLKSFNLGLGTEDIYGLFSPNAFGESFNLRLRCKL